MLLNSCNSITELITSAVYGIELASLYTPFFVKWYLRWTSTALPWLVTSSILSSISLYSAISRARSNLRCGCRSINNVGSRAISIFIGDKVPDSVSRLRRAQWIKPLGLIQMRNYHSLHLTFLALCQSISLEPPYYTKIDIQVTPNIDTPYSLTA